MCSLFYFNKTYSQNLNLGELHGNFQLDAQYYNEDEKIGATDVPEKLLTNGFANLIYTKDKISAGLRYESYLNPLQGFDQRFKGSGIPYRFLTYKADELEVTVGNYYEQFGSGMILRSYEEKNLGIDNAFDGIRLRYNPFSGIYLKGLVGRQRSFFSIGQGIVRGFDAEVLLNESFKKLAELPTKIIIGGSFVSKYQPDEDPDLVLPENVGASSGRVSIAHNNLNFSAEYVNKINDPSNDNKYIYKSGEGLLLNAGYAVKGFSLTVAGKRIDNMSYRSDRNANLTNLFINYLPALTKPHTYSLLAFYPYATQPNGEIGFQAEATYKIKKETPFGGLYGTEILVNYSGANSIDTVGLNDDETARKGYSSDFFSIGKEVYFRDLVIEINKKFTKELKTTFTYAYQSYNQAVINGLGGKPMIYSHITVTDITYKYTSDRAIRTEIQHLYTVKDMGSWAMGLVEYSIGSKWFLALQDQYNYGNKILEKRLHYFNVSAGFVKNANRIVLTYGRQRAGIFCVGGICRAIPASNGLLLSITSSF